MAEGRTLSDEQYQNVLDLLRSRNHTEERGSTPKPDPTVLTTEALMREIANLEKVLIVRIDRLHELNEKDVAAIDARLVAAQESNVTAREAILTKMDGVVGVQREKFNGVDQQFELVERQRVEQKNDTKAAVDAALTAQKEAVKEQTTASERAIAKSESGTTKQLEQLAEQFRTEIGGIRSTMDDLKERVTTMANLRIGGDQQRTDARSSLGATMAIVFGVLGTFVGLAGLAVLIIRISSGH